MLEKDEQVQCVQYVFGGHTQVRCHVFCGAFSTVSFMRQGYRCIEHAQVICRMLASPVFVFQAQLVTLSFVVGGSGAYAACLMQMIFSPKAYIACFTQMSLATFVYTRTDILPCGMCYTGIGSSY